MASITLNLDNVVADALHRPSIDNIPLYTRIDGKQDDKDYRAETARSDKWDSISKHTYSSPTNVRKLFICGDKIIVQTYKPIIKNGTADSNGSWREIKLDSNKNILNFAKQKYEYPTKFSKYCMEKNINPKAEAPKHIVIKGTGLGALTKNWVYSNIEEIYFDWTILTSEECTQVDIVNKLLKLCMQGSNEIIMSNALIGIFLTSNSNNIKDIRTRFPRLKCMALISNLSSVLNCKHDKGENIFEDRKNKRTTWIASNMNIIKQTKSLVCISELRDIHAYNNTNFSIRSGIYRFDEEILASYFNKFIQESKNDIVKKEVTQNIDDDIIEIKNDNKSDLECLLDDVMLKKGEAGVKSVIAITFNGLGINEINNSLNEMSTEGKEKYKVLAGIGG